MATKHISITNIRAYSYIVNRLRQFFLERNFCEVHTQDRLSILAACEDPATMAPFHYEGNVWPLPQTGQMWLEYELLKNPGMPGVFCVSTSFRQEPNPIPGRHELIFPMFEFEAPGTFPELQALEMDLCEFLGLGNRDTYCHKTYDEAAQHYGTHELEASHEMRMRDDFGEIVFLERFPLHTSPFWNMKREGAHARKADVIICGMETIGSAERSCNTGEMRKEFYVISNGQYAEKLHGVFGKKRVSEELEEFLALDFFPRFGGGIGMTRLMRALNEYTVR